jgi:hypothetical protein
MFCSLDLCIEGVVYRCAKHLSSFQIVREVIPKAFAVLCLFKLFYKQASNFTISALFILHEAWVAC